MKQKPSISIFESMSIQNVAPVKMDSNEFFTSRDKQQGEYNLFSTDRG
jgi:hypothetical protein